MALKVPNGGELLLLNWAVKAATAPDLTLHLFANNYSPTDTSVVSDFTEADFTGYASKSLARSGWDNPTTNGDGKAEITFGTAQTFAAESAQTVYGYYVTEDDNDTLVYAERFGSSRSLSAGDELNITPVITLSTES